METLTSPLILIMNSKLGQVARTAIRNYKWTSSRYADLGLRFLSTVLKIQRNGVVGCHSLKNQRWQKKLLEPTVPMLFVGTRASLH